jgi:hypothetical protein
MILLLHEDLANLFRHRGRHGAKRDTMQYHKDYYLDVEQNIKTYIFTDEFRIIPE